MRRRAIVNADDFGRSPGVNRGVIAAFERGIVTSASLMTRWPATAEAALWARRNTGLGLGLHIDFGEWAYRNGEWIQVYSVVDENDAGAVAWELARQIEAFERLIGRAPTHLDSHQHVHLRQPAQTAVAEAGVRLGVPVRGITPGIQYCGRFYGQDDRGDPYPECIGPEALIAVLAGLGAGTTEIGCHPAAGADLDSVYRFERETELAALCDPRVRAALAEMDVELCSFGRSPAGEMPSDPGPVHRNPAGPGASGQKEDLCDRSPLAGC
jgi:chitin disaccharide deacetylase